MRAVAQYPKLRYRRFPNRRTVRRLGHLRHSRLGSLRYEGPRISPRFEAFLWLHCPFGISGQGCVIRNFGLACFIDIAINMIRFNAFSWRRKQNLKGRHYVFAFVVAYFIPVASVYIRSFYILWSGANFYQAVNPLDPPYQVFMMLCPGATTFLALIPFLRYPLLRWCVALALCGIWLWLGLLNVAKQR